MARCWPTSCFPRSSAAALKDGRFPGLLPQKTQIVRTGPRPPPPPLPSADFSWLSSMGHKPREGGGKDDAPRKGGYPLMAGVPSSMADI